MENLIEKITDKKELRGVEKEFIKKIIKEYEKNNLEKINTLKQKEYNTKSKEYIELKKYVRKRLRELHGLFQKNKLSNKKKKEYIKDNNFDFYADRTQKFLKSHRSTKERLSYYETLYSKIEKDTGKIMSLADLGCGLNPLSYSLLKDLKDVFCADINEEEIQFIQDFIINNKKIKGEALVVDLTQKENYELIKKNTKKDCCFLFKTLDGLESISRGASKKLLENINSKIIIISFSNKTISGKNITSERKWFQEIIKELENKGRKTKKIILGNEDYYMIK
jgi:2-polyprenyl-3-methyl-5-hydroxy-6-metoxy-1,4-benzoquinol methylase